jgi:Dolichyl-phosphate-mannose-protein mannosyltransferase
MTAVVEAPPGAGSTTSAAPALTDPESQRSSRAARLRPLVRPACYYLASRVAVFVTASATAIAHPSLRVVQTFGSLWDGRWYLMIAQHGYPQHIFNEGDGSRWAFFPAFPAAVRGAAELTRLSLPDAATLAAFVFGLTSALAIWLAVREVFGDLLADRAVLLYVFCPVAYVLSLGYTEGLFITVSALCLYALARRWWITAALSACVAGLTRNAGIVVVLAVLVTVVPAAWRGRALRPAAAAAIAPVGIASFMAYGWAMVGTPVAFLHAERFWHGQHFVWFVTPVEALVSALHQGPTGASFVPDAMAGAALVLGFVGIWLLDRMQGRPRLVSSGMAGAINVPAAWWVYTVGTMLVAYSAYYTDSIPRYAMAAFPLFVAFAWKVPARFAVPLAAVMAFLQCVLFVVVMGVYPGLPSFVP